jgi:hypothetical protein
MRNQNLVVYGIVSLLSLLTPACGRPVDQNSALRQMIDSKSVLEDAVDSTGRNELKLKDEVQDGLKNGAISGTWVLFEATCYDTSSNSIVAVTPGGETAAAPTSQAIVPASGISMSFSQGYVTLNETKSGCTSSTGMSVGYPGVNMVTFQAASAPTRSGQGCAASNFTNWSGLSGRTLEYSVNSTTLLVYPSTDSQSICRAKGMGGRDVFVFTKRQ